MAEEPKFEAFVRDGNLTFDLTRIGDLQFNARIAWALRLGLAASIKGPNLGWIVASLRRMKPPAVIVGNSIRNTIPYPIDGVWAATAAGLATWLDPKSGKRNDYAGPPGGRTDLRIYLSTTSYPQSCVEYLWHELLHLVAPFTHRALTEEPQGADVPVDHAKWRQVMDGVALELPRELRDPLTGVAHPLTPPLVARECKLCAVTS